MKTLMILLVLLSIGFPCVCAQKMKGKYGPRRSTGDRAMTAPAFFTADVLDTAAIEIKGARSAVTTTALNCDRRIINIALPQIESQFEQRGFNKEETFLASLDSWKEIRLHSDLPPEKCMNQTSYIDYVTSLGDLIFRTTPDQASIELDGNGLEEKTKHSHWYEPRTYRVRYTKVGYEPFETQCEVYKGKRTDCYAELKKTP